MVGLGLTLLTRRMQLVLATEPQQKPGALTVALVTSDAALRSSLRLLLTVSGMNVHEYRTAQEFLAAGPGPYACLVVDCQLADMPGHRICAEAAGHNKRLPVVILAAFPEDFEAANGAHPGIHVVRKPFDGDFLINTIEDSAGTGPGHGPEDRAPPDVRPSAS